MFWRISIPLSALVLTVLAIPLAYVNPRVGRSFNLLSGVFLYMLYSNTLNVVQSLIAQGKVNFWVGLALPHLVAVAIVLVLFSNQLSVLGLVRNPFARRASAMKTLTRYIGREVLASIALIFASLVLLFAFFDLINELGDVGRDGYSASAALLFVALQLPSRMYELFPISALIGTLFAISQLVSNSEYTVMRASGVSLTAGAVGAGARRHPAGDRHVPCRRVRLAAGGAPGAGRARVGQGRDAALRRAAVPVGVLVPAGPHLRQHPRRARRQHADRHAASTSSTPTCG